MAALLVEQRMGMQEGGEGLEELLNTWARSPSARPLRPDEEGEVLQRLAGPVGACKRLQAA